MKKYLFILILLCGCSREAVKTIVEVENNVVIGINYPKTNIKKLDNIVTKYVNSVYKGFKEEYEDINTSTSELNIDYQYWTVSKRYINIILHIFIDKSDLAHPINEIKTFVYDKKENQLITLKDIINKNTLNELIPYLKESIIKKYKDCFLAESLTSEIIPDFNNYEYFTIDSDNLVLYFEPYKITSGNCNVISIDIPLKKIGLEFEKEAFNEEYVINNVKTIDPYKKVIAITFDDGPSKYTKDIVELFKHYKGNATFFVLGNKVKIYDETLKKAISLGNEIGNHSYNHKWLTRLDVDEFKLQIDKTQNIIKQTTGYQARLLRPTYGSVNKKIRNNTDLKIILWDVDSNDWKIKDSKKIAKRVLNDADDMDIILFHDTYERTYKALKIVLPKLIENGYQLVTVSQLEEVKQFRNRLK
ncbi:MAG: polysaccharide deacetylase family protein [Bacilli bacterium]